VIPQIRQADKQEISRVIFFVYIPPKIIQTKLVMLLKTYYHAKFEDPISNWTSVVPISEVYMAAKQLLLIAGN
jgi:hypothetical protein